MGAAVHPRSNMRCIVIIIRKFVLAEAEDLWKQETADKNVASQDIV